MRLDLDRPATWRLHDDGTYHIITHPGVRVAVGPLIPCPPDVAESVDELLGYDLPPGGQLIVIERRDVGSALGWPMRLVHATVVSTEGELLETRIAAIFGFFEYSAAVLVRGPDALVAREQLVEVIATGRPDWSSGTASVAEMMDRFPVKAPSTVEICSFWSE